MKIAIAADWHLGHDKLSQLSGRPANFSEIILDNLYLGTVKSDVLIFLGDICIRNDKAWHDSLSMALPFGLRRWLILGNHDRKTKSWYLRNGWDFVADELTLEVYGKRLLLTHIPRPPGGYDLNIHGHLHNTGHHPECGRHDKQYLVMSEHHYRPLILRSILKEVHR